MSAAAPLIADISGVLVDAPVVAPSVRSPDAHFHLYRLFEFRKSPRLFDLAGPVERNCLLNPISYVGRFS